MNNRLLTFIAGMGSTLVLLAAPLTPEQALQRVKGMDAPSGMRVPAASSMTLQRTVSTVSNEPAVYLFGNSDHMLVVAADDEVTPLLGYIDGSVSGEMPPQMKWWLQEYADQIELMRANAAQSSPTGLRLLKPAKTAPAKAARTAIDPMVTTSWNQGAPYNNLCPEIDGSRAVTGCVATAAAQVMKYFEWPPQGEGTITYNDNGVTRSLNLSSFTFDWDNMLDSYNSYNLNYNDTQATAVAQLMQAAGYAAHMSYGVEGSGAIDIQMLIGAQEYFKYNEGAQAMNRDAFDADEWEQLIYDNLSTVGPIYYAGADEQLGGHAFVCDGYDNNGYFHFNWGWGGAYDGYFKLDALNPDGQGTGGNSGNFNYRQMAFLNFTTPEGATITLPAQSPFTFQGNMTASLSGKYIVFGSDLGEQYACMYNSSGRDGDFSFAMKVTSADGTTIKYGKSRDISFQANYGPIQINLEIPSDLADGNYTATIAVRYQNSTEWLDVIHNPSFKCYVDMVVKDGNVTLEGQAALPFNYSDLTADASVSASKNLHYSFKAANPNAETASETLIPLLGTLDDGLVTPIAWGSQFQVKLNANETKIIEKDMLVNLLQGYKNFTGDAVFCLIDPSSNILAHCFVTVVAPEVLVTSITINPSSAEANVGDGIQLQATVLPENATNKTLAWSSSDETIATVDNTGMVSLLKEGKVVITASATDNSKISATCEITIRKPVVLVESITVDPKLWSGKKGDSIQLSVVITPENATDKNVVWSSSNEDVATVDANGLVTANMVGDCIITVRTTDGSNLSAQCEISTVSGVLSIMAADEVVDIYDLNGMLVKKDCTRDDLKSIFPGAYILRQGNQTRKVIIR